MKLLQTSVAGIMLCLTLSTSIFGATFGSKKKQKEPAIPGVYDESKYGILPGMMPQKKSPKKLQEKSKKKVVKNLVKNKYIVVKKRSEESKKVSFVSSRKADVNVVLGGRVRQDAFYFDKAQTFRDDLNDTFFY